MSSDANPVVEPATALILERLQKLAIAPKREETDEFAMEFKRLEKTLLQAKASVTAAQAPVETLKQELIDLVRNFGGAHREKSKLLHGIGWEIMATFGQSTVQDAAAVERLRAELKKKKLARLLKRLFTEEKRWTFSSNAMQVVKGEKLSPKLMGLVLQCFVTSDRTPILDVREKKAAPAM
jgi:hypothetical protein